MFRIILVNRGSIWKIEVIVNAWSWLELSRLFWVLQVVPNTQSHSEYLKCFQTIEAALNERGCYGISLLIYINCVCTNWWKHVEAYAYTSTTNLVFDVLANLARLTLLFPFKCILKIVCYKWLSDKLGGIQFPYLDEGNFRWFPRIRMMSPLIETTCLVSRTLHKTRKFCVHREAVMQGFFRISKLLKIIWKLLLRA